MGPQKRSTVAVWAPVQAKVLELGLAVTAQGVSAVVVEGTIGGRQGSLVATPEPRERSTVAAWAPVQGEVLELGLAVTA